MISHDQTGDFLSFHEFHVNFPVSPIGSMLSKFHRNQLSLVGNSSKMWRIVREVSRKCPKHSGLGIIGHFAQMYGIIMYIPTFTIS